VRLVAIDPGVRHLGVAVFDNGRLVRARLVEIENLTEITYAICREVVIEKPQVYPKSPGDPNDLIDLAIVVGRIAGHFEVAQPLSRSQPPRFSFYKPSQWKGQTPKPIHHARIRAELERQGTLSCVEIPRAKSLAHNIWDAVGLGLFHIKKTKGR
jgi:hypothetical protein